MRRVLLFAGCALVALGSVTTAHAAVHVRVAADAAQNPVSSENAYTVTVTTDAPVNLGFVRALLPGHGAPPITQDIYGQPRDTDDDTQFVVLDAHGGEVEGRWVSWPVFAPLLPGGVVVERVDVLTPQLEAYLQAGAWATTTDHTPVDGTRRGAQIWNQQDTESLHTGGTASIDGRAVTIDWWVQNGTSESLSLDTERFGVRAGAAYNGSSLDPVAKVRHVASLGVIWHTPIVLAPGERVDFTVRLTSPCGVGQVGARLRVYAGSIVAGTGDAGPHWKLPDCGGAS